jgi:hypothetical protein
MAFLIFLSFLEGMIDTLNIITTDAANPLLLCHVHAREARPKEKGIIRCIFGQTPDFISFHLLSSKKFVDVGN